ncbi:MAG: low temperature requirement protein A [Actinomycetota bacterium]
MTAERTPGQRGPRLRTTLRRQPKVSSLELFFDLVFALGFTQCTALMVAEPTWTGVAQGLLALAVLWWAWAGYAWLTSTVDPDEGAVRIAMFAAMAAMLAVALAVPEAFGALGLTFALAYGVVRGAHIVLFLLASRDDPALRRSVASLAVSSAVAVGLLAGAAFLDGIAQALLWALTILIDFGGPALFGVAGWTLVPAHFADRHGRILILALGVSIVALGVAAERGVTPEVIAAAVLGLALAAALWWLHFDLVAPATERRLLRAAVGRERNALARDSYSYLHLPMVAGVILVAVGLQRALAGVDEPLPVVPAAALLGGVAIYLLAHVLLQVRTSGPLDVARLALVFVLPALIPVAAAVPTLVTLPGVTVVLWALIAYETRRHRETRAQLRRNLSDEPSPS